MPRKALDKQMASIRRDILEMSELVCNAVSKALTAFKENDGKLAYEVIIGDDLINNYYTHIKRRSIQTIALQQPVARDLRFISISLDVAYNLERIGDYAKDIAEHLEHMNKGYFVLDEILEMGGISVEMIRDSSDAFVKEDREKIDRVMGREGRVDELYRSIFPILKDAIEKKCEKCPAALNLILIAKFIERIGDHSVNIANRAMYELSGKEKYL
jgi:phosphate transport system protein